MPGVGIVAAIGSPVAGNQCRDLTWCKLSNKQVVYKNLAKNKSFYYFLVVEKFSFV